MDAVKNNVDCLIIGNNQMNFPEYVRNIRKMGEKSGAFRDLNLSFYEEDGRIISCKDYFNEHYKDASSNEMSYDNIFSATITYLCSFLHKHNYSSAYINSFQEEKEKLKSLLKDTRFGIIAITTTYYVSALPIQEIVEFVKKYQPDTKIIIGGPYIQTQNEIHDHSSLRFLTQQLGADFYVISAQGEQAMVKVLTALKENGTFDHINNLVYKDGEDYVFNHMHEEDNDLSENPVNWDLFRQDFIEKERKMVMVRSVNSCPFSCTFCSFPAHAGAFRYVPPEHLCCELDQIASIEQINSVTFIDDTFNVPLRRYKEILRLLLEKKYNFRWNCNFRCQYADYESVALMKEAGCEGVFLGIESGSEPILKNMNKRAKIEDYQNGIALLREHGIATYASFIIGFPGETEETVQDTIEFIETCKPDFFRAQLWYYDTMTPIHKEADKFGLKNSQFEWEHNTMNAAEAAEWIDYMHLNIKNSVWLPQNDFDYPSLFNLMSRGWTVPQIKEMLIPFNEKVNQKLRPETGAKVFVDEAMLQDTGFEF